MRSHYSVALARAEFWAKKKISMTSLLTLVIRLWQQWITNFNFRFVSYRFMKGASRELELTFWPWKSAKKECI